jgi:hypothetical protein
MEKRILVNLNKCMSDFIKHKRAGSGSRLHVSSIVFIEIDLKSIFRHATKTNADQPAASVILAGASQLFTEMFLSVVIQPIRNTHFTSYWLLGYEVYKKKTKISVIYKYHKKKPRLRVSISNSTVIWKYHCLGRHIEFSRQKMFSALWPR